MTRLSRILPVLIAAAALAAGCDQSIEIHSPPDGASAARAPSLADKPVDATPATHDGNPQAPAAQATARDTAANAPAETLTREKEASQMPLAGQVNNHSSPAFEKHDGAGG